METLSFLKDGYKNTSSNGAKQVVISMNQNTVQTIRDAELAAEETAKKAALERESILAKAKSDCAQSASKMISDAKARAAVEVEQARLLGEGLQKEALTAAESKIDGLRAQAQSRRKEALNLILSELV